MPEDKLRDPSRKLRFGGLDCILCVRAVVSGDGDLSKNDDDEAVDAGGMRDDFLLS